MAKKRKTVSMKKIFELLRMHYDGDGLSNREIGRALQISKDSVSNYIERFQKSGLSWPLDQKAGEDELRQKLNPIKIKPKQCPIPDWSYIHTELGKKKYVTLFLLWEEYRETYPTGLAISQFYNLYRQWCKKNMAPSLHMMHKGGDKIFVDYSGQKPCYIERSTGEITDVELFVSAWGASSYAYAECTASQQVPEWIDSHKNMFNYFGVVCGALVPDNLKSGVTKADFYDPDLNPTYALLAEHYNTVILPARKKAPKDKAIVENSVLQIQRFILGRLRNRKFFSLAEINQAVKELLVDFNNKPMQQYKVSRKERFEELDKPQAKPLPAEPFPFNQVKYDIGVNRDYHIEFDKHFYSVPNELCGQRMDVMASRNVVEIIHDRKRITSHVRGYKEYGYTTKKEHMPASHQFVKGWTPEKVTSWANQIGPKATELVKGILGNRNHPEQGFRAALGVIRLKNQYPINRIEKACSRASYYRQFSSKAVKAILEQKLEQEPLPSEKLTESNHLHLCFHENIRGEQYYG